MYSLIFCVSLKTITKVPLMVSCVSSYAPELTKILLDVPNYYSVRPFLDQIFRTGLLL